MADNSFESVAHSVRMESLQDAFSKDELREFSNRVEDTVSDVNYVVEPKIDGLSVSLEYRDGVFLRGSTRGNGDVGEDVSGNLRVIHNIPLKLNKSIPYIEVRGEVYMPKKSFERVVDRQIINGEKPFKNPRNAAAGSLRQKDSSVTASRGLDIFVFNIQQILTVQLLRLMIFHRGTFSVRLQNILNGQLLLNTHLKKSKQNYWILKLQSAEQVF